MSPLYPISIFAISRFPFVSLPSLTPKSSLHSYFTFAGLAFVAGILFYVVFRKLDKEEDSVSHFSSTLDSVLTNRSLSRNSSTTWLLVPTTKRSKSKRSTSLKLYTTNSSFAIPASPVSSVLFLGSNLLYVCSSRCQGDRRKQRRMLSLLSVSRFRKSCAKSCLFPRLLHR